MQPQQTCEVQDLMLTRVLFWSPYLYWPLFSRMTMGLILRLRNGDNIPYSWSWGWWIEYLAGRAFRPKHWSFSLAPAFSWGNKVFKKKKDTYATWIFPLVPPSCPVKNCYTDSPAILCRTTEHSLKSALLSNPNPSAYPPLFMSTWDSYY